MHTPRSQVQRPASARSRRGFTIPELLVVAGVIAILIALIVPALRGGLETAEMAKSQARLKQVATWMSLYSTDNRDQVLPSQFDYLANPSPGKVRATVDPSTGSPVNPQFGDRHQGTWTDILWVHYEVGVFPTAVGGAGHDYRYDSPDAWVYRNLDADFDNPFRSAAANTKDFATGDGTPKPFGLGATESGYAGYFAANNFFNTDPDGDPATPQVWWVNGQIRQPDRSMYLVDSLAGETIEPNGADDGPWDNPAMDPTLNQASLELEVDFRYNGACLMLFMDGHSSAQAPWRNLDELEGVAASALTETRAVKPRIRSLDKR